MSHATPLKGQALREFLRQARDTRAQVSLRPVGSPRLLGHLHIQNFVPGMSLELTGTRHRDLFPPDGSQVILSILLGEDVLSMETMLISSSSQDGDGPGLLLDWPQEPVPLHRRRDVRMAGPDQTPLRARVDLEGRSHDALLVNLTETGVGLAFQEALLVDLHALVQIETVLPGGATLKCPGEVRHLTFLEGQDYPTRLGVVLHPRAEADLEPMRRFIQARRTDRSQSFRQK